MKKCTKCKLEKQCSEFHKGKGKDGLKTRCKECCATRSKQYLAGAYESLESVLKEIIKCSVVCSNCHRKYHAGVLDFEFSCSKTISLVDKFRPLSSMARVTD